LNAQGGLFDPPANIPAPPRVSEREIGRRAVAEVASLPERAAYLQRIRDKMRQVYRMKVDLYGEHGASVTPDDARRYFESMNPPAGLSRNFLAAVWREPGWEIVGVYHSETRGSHGNKLNRYRWVG
jgi:hypothetical protein